MSASSATDEAIDATAASKGLCLQTMLGSDLLHEVLSWRDYTTGNVVHPSVFFEKPAAP